ncbi:nuclear transport factor 2 family protein [Mycolicibacillus parakoreensis]|uniref:Nuclear transport factor 2 family protein n=1 Tax=Mycolicibacillus parakoreensis TaxID=1069221 RepID=A0ABY3TZU0_9MYCO|nr:nuclear transport factor 2 family protein [Mycolicibacillus parakoreensis]MCV7316496.1 nuclear transport factor 2 family protein [Mycolicibacillus parakoreensis]ULN52727.1 nuclear transport factor 2 family protein [Mycolicibacillus parakoreensis]HLR99073.1 nuclear transport factor 2 family protein [Mycolicibacillus parakoreensis]
MTTPFDDPQAGLAWLFLQCTCRDGDLDEGFALLSEDFTYWTNITGDTLDKAAARRLLERRKQILEISLDLLGCINEGENVAVEASGTGVVDGTETTCAFAFFFETRDGLIVTLREYADSRLAAQIFPPDMVAPRGRVGA